MDSLTYDEQKRLLDLGALSEEDQAKLKLILSQMEGLQGAAKAPQARQYGNVTVAPHWMELVGGLAQQGAAMNKRREADDISAKLRARLQEQQALMLKGISGGQQQPQQMWPDATEGMGMLNNRGMLGGG